jgi:hypothetical protein
MALWRNIEGLDVAYREHAEQLSVLLWCQGLLYHTTQTQVGLQNLGILKLV